MDFEDDPFLSLSPQHLEEIDKVLTSAESQVKYPNHPPVLSASTFQELTEDLSQLRLQGENKMLRHSLERVEHENHRLKQDLSQLFMNHETEKQRLTADLVREIERVKIDLLFKNGPKTLNVPSKRPVSSRPSSLTTMTTAHADPNELWYLSLKFQKKKLQIFTDLLKDYIASCRDVTKLVQLFTDFVTLISPIEEFSAMKLFLFLESWIPFAIQIANVEAEKENKIIDNDIMADKQSSQKMDELSSVDLGNFFLICWLVCLFFYAMRYNFPELTVVLRVHHYPESAFSSKKINLLSLVTSCVSALSARRSDRFNTPLRQALTLLKFLLPLQPISQDDIQSFFSLYIYSSPFSLENVANLPVFTWFISLATDFYTHHGHEEMVINLIVSFIEKNILANIQESFSKLLQGESALHSQYQAEFLRSLFSLVLLISVEPTFLQLATVKQQIPFKLSKWLKVISLTTPYSHRNEAFICKQGALIVEILLHFLQFEKVDGKFILRLVVGSLDMMTSRPLFIKHMSADIWSEFRQRCGYQLAPSIS